MIRLAEIDLNLKPSVKDNRLLNYDDMRRLVRRENSLKNLQSVYFYGVHLETTQKEAIFIIELKVLNTYGVDNLSTALAQNFDDYSIIPDNKVIRVEAKYYYGDSI